jgi:type IV pilus assembly protein PilE
MKPSNPEGGMPAGQADHGRFGSLDCMPRGFTLVELMVVLAIVAILAVLVFPSYLETMRKSRRVEGRVALLKALQQQEQAYTQRRSYIAFSSSSSDEDARQFTWYSGAQPKESAYELSGEACAGEVIQNCISLIARPGTSKVQENYTDPICGILKLSSAGIREADGPDCWK